MTFVIELNNIGVSFLRSGNLDDAFDSFEVAVELMKQTTANKEQRAVRRRSVSQPLSVLRAKYEQGNTKLRGLDKECECFVSKAAIKLLEGVDLADDLWVSSILLFNLALSLHLMGLKRGKEVLLHKALKLYILSKNLIMQHLEEKEDKGVTRINTRLMTSILNNMGHISYELREYGASRAYFEGLTSMVAQWNARQRQNSEEFKGLLLNAIVLRQPPAAASA